MAMSGYERHYREMRRLCLQRCLMYWWGGVGNKKTYQLALVELRQLKYG